MFTLYCTDSELAHNLAALHVAAIVELGATTALALTQWPAERLQHARSASLELLADAAKPALDWCWS